VFLGRSNVGKSSLLNALVGQKIARTSRTPGKTQLLNVFRLPTLYLVDLPGYGFARASKTDRSRFRQMVETVIRRRERVRAVVWLIDVRHPPSTDDLAMRELLTESGCSVLAVLTKADKLPHGQRLRARAARAAELHLEAHELLLTSTETGLGLDELGHEIERQAGESGWAG
jgi:GTP-binding protein